MSTQPTTEPKAQQACWYQGILGSTNHPKANSLEQSQVTNEKVAAFWQNLLHGFIGQFPHVNTERLQGLKVAVQPKPAVMVHMLLRELQEFRSVTEVEAPHDGRGDSPRKNSLGNFELWKYMPSEASYRSKARGFAPTILNLDVADSYAICTCGDCDGRGKLTCGTCSGTRLVDCSNCNSGQASCLNCQGTGEIKGTRKESGLVPCDACKFTIAIPNHVCPYCDNRRFKMGIRTIETRERCGKCNGRGSVDCRTCRATGQLKCTVCDENGKVICSRCQGRKKIMTWLKITCKRFPTWRSVLLTSDSQLSQYHQLLTNPFRKVSGKTDWPSDLEAVFFRAPKQKDGSDATVSSQWVLSNTENLAKIHGMRDQALFSELEEAGAGPGMLACLVIIPLLLVASADGEVDEKEKNWLANFCQTDDEAFTSQLRETIANWLESTELKALSYAWLLTIIQLRSLVSAACLQMIHERIGILARELAGVSRGPDSDKGKVSKLEEVAMYLLKHSVLGVGSGIINEVHDIVNGQTISEQLAFAKQPISIVSRKYADRLVARKQVNLLFDQVIKLDYACGGYGVNLRGNDLQFPAGKHSTYVSKGMLFIYPHSGPAHSVSRHLAKDALAQAAEKRYRLAADNALMIREIGKFDHGSLLEYSGLMQRLPQGMESVVEQLDDQSFPLWTVIGGICGILVSFFTGFFTGWWLIAGLGILGSFGVVGGILFFRFRIKGLKL